ncbi:MAG: PorT family protein [Prevotella sp.]|nr:PorT family protein [Prevotella sp.]
MAEAQNQKGTFSIKPMAGVNISSLGSPTIEDLYHAKVRFTAGAEAEYAVKNCLGLSLGLMYSQQGANVDGSVALYQPLDNGEILYSVSHMDGYLHADYLNLPVMAHVYVPAIRGLSINAGVQVGLLVNDRMTADVLAQTIQLPSSQPDFGWYVDNYNNRIVVTSAVVTQNDVCKSFDFGIPLGLSYEYKNVSLDARYYFGLTQIDKTENPDTAKNRYFSITLGYRFHL